MESFQNEGQWYYIGIQDALKESFEGVEAYEEYTRLVNKIFEQE